MLIAAILLFQASAAPLAPPSDAALYRDCIAAAESGAPGAIDAAGRWVSEGGGVAARHCLGIAYMEANKPAEASTALETAARVAEAAGLQQTASLYGQAGDAALAAGDAARAERLLSSAILAGDDPTMRGASMIGRAAAREALGNVAGAREDLDAGLKLTPGNAGGWLMLAVLARRDERIADARAAIGRALALAPADPDVALEAGNMAAIDGDFARARALWQSVVKAAPDTPAGKAANDALLRNPQ